MLVEVIEDGGVDRGEFLQTSHLPDAKHRPFSSSKRLVGNQPRHLTLAQLIDSEIPLLWSEQHRLFSQHS